MMGKASALPLLATAPIASSVSENSSLANLATASSNGPARAGSATAIRNKESASVQRRAGKLASTVNDPGRNEWRRRRDGRLLPSFRFGSGARTEALVGLDVVV